MGSKKAAKDPGIPNSWPFKAEMLQELERKKEAKDKEMARRHQAAKEKAKRDHKELEKERRQVQQEREAARREKRAAEAESWQKGVLRRTLTEADVILEVLDARDPLGCRCTALEAWAQEKGKRLIFVLAKADLVTADIVARWLLLLGHAAPAIAVQAEAGRDGVRGLMALLGHAPESAAAGFPVATAVGVVGYAGVGKRALIKAIRQESKGPIDWLLEGCRLQPAPSFSPDAASSLHLAVRAAVPRGAATATSAAAIKSSGSGGAPASGGATEMVALVQHLLTRTTPQALMRRFRLPAFDSADAFLAAFAKDRDMKTKRDKVPPPEVIAKRIVTELPALPGCFCAPPEAPTDTGAALWQPHGDKRPHVERVMQEQIEVLKARGGAGPAGSALSITSSGPGPAVDLAAPFATQEEEFDFGQGGAEDEEDSEDDDMDGEDGEEEEGEEEEELSEADMDGDA